jgi:hypothetical protein
VITIKGLAYRTGSDPDDHSETWVIEDQTFHLRHMFSTLEPIGIATLTTLPNGNWQAEASIPREMAHKLHGCPYFAVGLRLQPGATPDRHGAVLATLSIADGNDDADLPPYVITSMPDDVPGRESILRDYRPVTVIGDSDSKATIVPAGPDSTAVHLRNSELMGGAWLDVTGGRIEWHHHAEKLAPSPPIGFTVTKGAAT